MKISDNIRNGHISIYVHQRRGMIVSAKNCRSRRVVSSFISNTNTPNDFFKLAMANDKQNCIKRKILYHIDVHDGVNTSTEFDLEIVISVNISP